MAKKKKKKSEDLFEKERKQVQDQIHSLIEKIKKQAEYENRED